MTIGIYSITNNITKQMYIGQSTNIEKRWNQHKNSLRKNNHYNAFLQRSWNKYKEENFSFDIIESFNENTPFIENVLNKCEEFYIKEYNTFENKNHYNLNRGGEFFARGKSNGMYGVKHSQETRKRIRDKKINKKNKNLSKKVNSTGFYRVSKKNKKETKYGFFYSYEYSLNGKRKSLNSGDLLKLKERVLKKNLEWEIIDKKKAKKTLELEKNKRKINESKRKN